MTAVSHTMSQIVFFLLLSGFRSGCVDRMTTLPGKKKFFLLRSYLFFCKVRTPHPPKTPGCCV